MPHLSLAFVLVFLLGFILGRWRPFAAPRADPPVPQVPIGRPPGQQPVEPIDAYPRELWLLDSGENKIKTIKTIRSFTHLGLRDAKIVCDRAPGPLCRVASAEDAATVRQMFQGIASIEIR